MVYLLIPIFVIALIKIHIKKNIRPTSWDTYSKMNGGKKHPYKVSILFIMAKEIFKVSQKEN